VIEPVFILDKVPPFSYTLAK